MIALLIKLFYTFFKIGLFTFGGGYAMIPLIEEEIMKNQWIESIQTLVDFIAISESTPGPFAINIATFVGYHQAGILGALFATIGVIMPSFIIIMLIARLFTRFSKNQYVQGFLSGIRPIIVGILFSVSIGFISLALMHVPFLSITTFNIDYKALILFVILFLLTRWKKKLHPVYLILISAGFGLILYGLL